MTWKVPTNHLPLNVHSLLQIVCDVCVCVSSNCHCSPQGGETEALKRLKESLSNISWVAAFEKPQVG